VGARYDANHFLRFAGVPLLAPAAMTRQTTLAARVARLFARPLVSSTLLMRSFPTFAGNLFLLAAIHGRKSAIFFCHVDPLVLVRHCRALLCNGGATIGAARESEKTGDLYERLRQVVNSAGVCADAREAHTV
jgi:hypothetical protein